MFNPYTQYFFAWPGEEQTIPILLGTLRMIGYHVYQGNRCPPIDNIIEGEAHEIKDDHLLGGEK